MKWKAKNIQRHKYDQVIWNIFHRTSRLAVNEHIYASIWVYWVRWIGFIYCLLVNTFAYSERRNCDTHTLPETIRKNPSGETLYLSPLPFQLRCDLMSDIVQCLGLRSIYEWERWCVCARLRMKVCVCIFWLVVPVLLM